MWEPVSTAVYEGVDFISPNMILGAKLATGRCSIAGMDHLTHYDHWTCPRVLMEAEVRVWTFKDDDPMMA